MTQPREACLMEGKFFVEIGQFTTGASEESHGRIGAEAQDGESDSDDEEETSERFFTNWTDDNSEKEDSSQPHDSGIDSLLLLETGTPASEENDDEEDGDRAFRPVVYSKKRRGSRGREAPSESNGSSDSNAASETVASTSRRYENDTTPETSKHKKKRKKKKKKLAAESPSDRPSIDDWDQLDMLDEDSGKDTPLEDSVQDFGPQVEAVKASPPEGKKLTTETAFEISAKEEPGASPKEKDIFAAGTLPNGSHKRSFSESYDNKSGIKSILKNTRSRTFSGESSCSDAAELGSSCGGKSNGCRSRNQSNASLTDVTQSMESLSISSILTSDSCCEEGHEDKCDHHQYCANSWSAGGTRKSVHFSAVIDRKRFRSGAPPVNIGKGRRCSTGKANVNQREHGKKRHMSEGDAGTALSRGDSARICNFVAGVSNGEESNGKADSPNEMSASSDDLFEMEELNGGEEGVICDKRFAVIDGIGSLLGKVPEEVEDQEIASDYGSSCENKSKKGRKNKSKKGRNKVSNSEKASTEFEEVKEGWSIVGNAKLGWRKGGSRNSSDLSLSSDVDDGHSSDATEVASDFGAISITDG